MARFFNSSILADIPDTMEEVDRPIKRDKHKLCLLIGSLVLCLHCLAQMQDTVIVAGSQYKVAQWRQALFGRHYRKEWATPVRVPVIQLDTIDGGLLPYQSGGGRQSKTLRLHNPQGKEYVLRSIDKTFGKALPEIFQHTIFEDIINDQVSIAHPYAAITIPTMANAAKIYHTIPQIVYVPAQKNLDTFNKEFGNTLYLLEQRPDGNWEEAENFAHSKKIISTEKLLEELKEHHSVRVDQLAFLRARLFDLFIGDWGRHEDQWRWAEIEKNEMRTYLPIPRDRDQAYTKFDGTLLSIALSAAGLSHLQSFDYTIKDVNRYAFPARFLDRHLLTEPSLQQWLDIAKDLRQSLTDDVIEAGVKKLPPELFPISGEEIIAKLKSRRDQLPKFAREYYRALAKEVELTGTEKNEYFEVKRLNDEETAIAIYEVNKEGQKDAQPAFQRTFKNSETSEVRMYGIAGNDIYKLEGNVSKGLNIRVIGGTRKDSIMDRSSVSGKAGTVVYDNPGNYIERSTDTKVHLSNSTKINDYQYDGFHYNKKGIQPIAFYNHADKIFVGLGYGWKNYKWRRTPMANEHSLSARYSIPQNAFDFLYKGTVYQFIGKWNLSLDAHYDFILWTNFFGLGNETSLLTKDPDFYRMRSRDGQASVGLNRNLGKYNKIGFNLFYQNVKVIDDTDRFLAKKFLDHGRNYDTKQFSGASVIYNLEHVDDRIVPTKGINFQGSVSYTQNIKETNRSVTKYIGDLDVYLPLVKNLVLAMHTGAATLSGEPEFYQYNSIGGRLNLRGYRRDRFWAKTTFYNSNELQWLFDLNTYFVNGKFGLIALYDQGRVWQPGENSNLWHRGVGGGFLIAPFNKLMISLTYAKSKEFSLFHLRFNR